MRNGDIKDNTETLEKLYIYEDGILGVWIFGGSKTTFRVPGSGGTHHELGSVGTIKTATIRNLQKMGLVSKGIMWRVTNEGILFLMKHSDIERINGMKIAFTL